MSFTSSRLRTLGSRFNGSIQQFEYDTSDTFATVAAAYFTNGAVNWGIRVGDEIIVRHWRGSYCSPLVYVVTNAETHVSATPRVPGVTFNGVDVLDQYAAGVWTPAPTFATPGNAVFTVAAASGTYRRVGDIVVVSANLQFLTNGYSTASGLFRVTGLPFPVDASGTFPLAVSNVGKFIADHMSAEAVGGQSYMQFRAQASGVASGGDHDNPGAGINGRLHHPICRELHRMTSRDFRPIEVRRAEHEKVRREMAEFFMCAGLMTPETATRICSQPVGLELAALAAAQADLRLRLSLIGGPPVWSLKDSKAGGTA